MAPLEQPTLCPKQIYLSALSPVRRSPQRGGFAASAAMESSGGSGMTNLLLGPLLQCLEAASLGMPFEARWLLLSLALPQLSASAGVEDAHGSLPQRGRHRGVQKRLRKRRAALGRRLLHTQRREAADVACRTRSSCGTHSVACANAPP
jgi:hypothetical protein